MGINNQLTHKYADKMAEMQVLGCLVKDPMLFSDNKYKFNIEDFSDQFHRILFGAIENIAINGAQSISYIDIDQFLKAYPTQYKVFSDNQGPDYILNMLELVDEKNRDYYYKRMKKMSVLNDFNDKGFDVSSIYDDQILDPVKLSEMQRAFDKMSVDDIILHFETELIQVKEKFQMSRSMQEGLVGDGIDEQIESYNESPAMGLPLSSPKLTTIFRGMQLGKFYLESSSTGQGKTRRQVETSARIGVGEYYDLTKCKWVDTGIHEPILYISVELKREEMQSIWVANIAGIPEDKIIDGYRKFCTPAEQERVRHANELIKKNKMYFVRISNFSVEDILNIIKKHYQIYGVHYVFLDYLSTSMKIIQDVSSKTRLGNIREDQILYMYAGQLKDLCEDYDIAIWASTQLSGDYKNAKDADQGLLRGSKAMADKIDYGDILLPVREADKPIIAAHIAKGFELEPTSVLHIYKARKGKFNFIKLYIHFDKATCRTTDCFATNNEGEIIDITDTNVEIILDQTTDNSPIGSVTENGDIVDENIYDTPINALVEEQQNTVKKFDGFNF